MENNKKKSLIPKAALIKAWLIWETFPQTCYNYERMMGQVVAHMFSAIIGFLYKDDPSKRKEVMKREIEFFNVHIEFGSCILGMAVALEEQKAMGENIPGEFITNLKTSLMGPLAGMGDTIWQGVVIPILLAVCIRFNTFRKWKCMGSCDLCSCHRSSSIRIKLLELHVWLQSRK